MSQNLAWSIDEGVRVMVGERVYVSFERTRRLAPGDVPRSPSSYGAAPIAPSGSGQGADVMVPVREDEAFWLGLSAVDEEIPCAVRVIVREPIAIDAATGAAPLEGMSSTPQNYVVVPLQHAVTGVVAGNGVARQFVRISHSSEDAPCHRVELIVFAATRRLAVRASSPPPLLHQPADADSRQATERNGLAVQRIGADPHGLEAWRGATPRSVVVELVAPEIYTGRTCRAAPAPLRDDMKYGGWRLP